MIFRASDPFQALLEFQRAIEQSRSSDWLGSSISAPGAFPPINVFRQNDDYVAIIELPGINKDDLDIEAKENVIRVKGERRASYPEGASAHRRERVFGTFDRTISVPIRIDADRIIAEYRNGILALHNPRTEADKPKKVAIS